MARKETAAAVKPLAKAALIPASKPAKVAPEPMKATSKPVGRTSAPKAAAKTPAAAVRGSPKAASAKAKAKAKVASPPAKPVTITLKHLAAGLSESRGLPKQDAEAFAAQLIGDLVEQVKGGAKVRIVGLGVIEIKDRPARMARNPATGAAVQVEASRKIVFRIAKELKDAI